MRPVRSGPITMCGESIKAVFFDNDGVLVDTEGLYFEANRRVLSGEGIELTLETFTEVSLSIGKSVIRHFSAELDMLPEEVEQLHERRNVIYNQLLSERPSIIAGVEPALLKLHGKLPLAIVTSSLREHFESAHAHGNLLRFFDFVLTREQYELSKPNPEPYLTAARRVQVDPAECLVIEDSERGVKAAAAAGMQCIAIPNRLTKQGDFSSADRIFASVSEAVEFILTRLS